MSHDLGIISLLHITCVKYPVYTKSHLFWNACADLNRGRGDESIPHGSVEWDTESGIMWFVAVWTLATTHKHEGCLPSVFQRMLCIQVKWTVDSDVAGNWQRDNCFILIGINSVLFSIHLTWYVIYVWLQKAIIIFSKCRTLQKHYWFCRFPEMFVI